MTLSSHGSVSATSAKRVLVIAGDVLPLPGLPTTGAGLRAWALGQGLRSHGHNVTFAMNRLATNAGDFKPTDDVVLYENDKLPDLVSQFKSDILLFQHWPLVNYLRERHENTIIDFHGPWLLESLFRIGGEVVDFYAKKLQALVKADYFTCAGERQRNYFYAWLEMAGFDLRDLPIQVVPFALSPELPRHEFPRDMTFVYGGVFLPWQSPTLGLRVLLDELERSQTAKFHFFGGKHPICPVPVGEYQHVLTMLQRSSQTTMFPMTQHRELIEHYRNASVAWDLMSHNCERGMAITSRTVEYMWAGLPVVYNDYAELSEHIRHYNAGWLVNPENADDIRRVVQEILRSPEEVRQRGENAQRLVRDKFTWDKAAEPLHRFALCPKAPRRFPNVHAPSISLRQEVLDRLKLRVRRFPVTYKIARLVWKAGRKGVSLCKRP